MWVFFMQGIANVSILYTWTNNVGLLCKPDQKYGSFWTWDQQSGSSLYIGSTMWVFFIHRINNVGLLYRKDQQCRSPLNCACVQQCGSFLYIGSTMCVFLIHRINNVGLLFNVLGINNVGLLYTWDQLQFVGLLYDSDQQFGTSLNKRSANEGLPRTWDQQYGPSSCLGSSLL